MYIVCIVLFVLGMYATGVSFDLEPEFLQAIVFVAGILLVCIALAIPIHTTRRNMTAGSPPSSNPPR